MEKHCDRHLVQFGDWYCRCPNRSCHWDKGHTGTFVISTLGCPCLLNSILTPHPDRDTERCESETMPVHSRPVLIALAQLISRCGAAGSHRAPCPRHTHLPMMRPDLVCARTLRPGPARRPGSLSTPHGNLPGPAATDRPPARAAPRGAGGAALPGRQQRAGVRRLHAQVGRPSERAGLARPNRPGPAFDDPTRARP